MERVKSFIFERAWYDIARLLPDDERLAAFDAILSHVFYPEQETTAGPISKYVIPLIDQQLKRQMEIVDKRRAAGAMGGNAKAKKQPLTPPEGREEGSRVQGVQGVQDGTRELRNSGMTESGETESGERMSLMGPLSRMGKGRRYEPRNGELFVVFWNRYALKKDKEGAIRAWNRLSDKEQEEAVNGIEAYKKQCEDEQRARMYPQGYLSHRRWTDEPAPNKSITIKTNQQYGDRDREKEKEKDKRRGMEVTATQPSDFQSTF